MTAQKTEALRLADKYEVEGFLRDHRFAQDEWCRQAALELRRLHAANTDCMAWYESAKQEIACLVAIVRVLEAQLESIGAGGVEPLRRHDHFRDATEMVPEEQKMTAYQQVVAAWNAQADETNQWDALGEDEKIEWALKCADQFRGATKMM